MAAAAATLRWVLQLHRDVPRAARFYAEGLDFSVARSAGPSCSRGRSSSRSCTPTTVILHHRESILRCCPSLYQTNSTVSKLMALGAELDGPIKYEIHGKVAALRCIDGHMLGLYEPA